MPKNKKEFNLGRSLIKSKSRNAAKKKNLYRAAKASGLEAPENFVDYGGIDGSTSITELNSLDDFIAQAKLANRKFQTERTATIIRNTLGEVETEGEEVNIHLRNSLIKQQLSFTDLGIPRRPPWTRDMTAEQLDVQERKAFIDWRREIAVLEEEHKASYVTPFEKNLQFWRQLWRTMERSHVVCQIVDARYPLLFRCPDIERYAKEMHATKDCLLIVNKADFLDDEARRIWGEYFHQNNIEYIFFSARDSQEALDAEFEAESMAQSTAQAELEDNLSALRIAQALAKEKVTGSASEGSVEPPKPNPASPLEGASGNALSENGLEDPNRILTRKELLRILQQRAEMAFNKLNSTAELDANSVVSTGKGGKKRKARKQVPAIGMVGYPNVGKSSVINVVLGVAKTTHGAVRVAVGSTPGKTKHFQTIVLSDNLTLCDCPGLVFPTFMSSKSEMICHGILPIDQMKDYLNPIALVISRVYPEVFENTYALNFPKSSISGRRLPLDPHSLLQTYSAKHGYYGAHHAGPDEPRGARYILKDFVSGKIPYCCPPPGMDPMVLMPKPQVEDLSDTGRHKLKNGVTLVVGNTLDGSDNGRTAGNDVVKVGEDTAAADPADLYDDDFDESELTLEEAAAILGEDDLELEEENAIRKQLMQESIRKQKHRSMKKKGRKGRDRTATPYNEDQNARVYGGVKINVQGKGLANRKAKMMEKHASKKKAMKAAGKGKKASGAQLLM